MLRRIRVAQDFREAVRVPGAFIVQRDYVVDAGPTLSWRTVADDEARQLAFTALTTQQAKIALLPIGTDPFAGIAVLVAWGEPSPETSQTELLSEVAHADGRPSSAQIIGAAFKRGTMAHTHAVSIDGARAVFTSGHVAVDDPHAFLIDAAGARMGDAVGLIDTGNSPLFDCLAATPTLHAGAVSATDRTNNGAETWHLVELAADGSVAQRVSLDASEIDGCPHVQLARDGLTIGVRDRSGAFLAYAARDGELMPLDIHLTLLRPQSLPLWIGELAPGRWLVLQSEADLTTRMAQRGASGSFEPVPGELPKLRSLIASEPGRLFAVALADEPAPDQRDILELGCAL